MTNYVLDAKLNPVPEPDLIRWARWFETADRTVCKTTIGDVLVSTVFLGVDHSWGAGEPLLYETLVFGGLLDGEMRRYATRKGALCGHGEVVGDVRGKLL